ncbi:hypothetical protein JCM8547_001887 [Rhodosporidiobolus lusitaniae]
MLRSLPLFLLAISTAAAQRHSWSGRGPGRHSSSSSSSTSKAASSSSATSSTQAATTTTATTTSSAAANTSTSSHKLLKEHSGSTFFDGFDFKNITDPTSGLVSYLPSSDAWSRSLVSITSDDTVLFSIDRESTLALNENRPSVRIESQETYSEGLFVADFKHAPVGCSVWPAWWLFNEDWPNGGEIDILEGVNERAYNTMTLHTANGCTRDTSSSFSGNAAYSSTDCYARAYGASSGCGIVDDVSSSLAYGTGFNSAGGGVYAMLLDPSSGIKIWFWSRGDVPSDVESGSPEPEGWGTPVAAWGTATCDIETYFYDLKMTFDITTCGGWAGDASVWSATDQSGSCSSSYSTCAEAVQDPTNFEEAYFEINYIKVYSV